MGRLAIATNFATSAACFSRGVALSERGPGVAPGVVARTLLDVVVGEANATSSQEQSQVTFVDEDGDENRISTVKGQVRWCSAQQPPTCHTLKQLQFDLRGKCRFEVSFRQPETENVLVSVIARPAPGLEQRDLAERLLRMARGSGVEVAGDGLWALRTMNSTGSDEELLGQLHQARVHEPLIQFSLPSDESAEKPGRAQLRIPGQWKGVNTTGFCAAIVERPEDCHSCTFGRECDARALQRNGTLTFDVPRPDFTIAAAGLAHNHSVCFKGPPMEGAEPGFGLLVIGRVELVRS